jgi:hypothetical protein
LVLKGIKSNTLEEAATIVFDDALVLAQRLIVLQYFHLALFDFTIAINILSNFMIINMILA